MTSCSCRSDLRRDDRGRRRREVRSGNRSRAGGREERPRSGCTERPHPDRPGGTEWGVGCEVRLEGWPTSSRHRCRNICARRFPLGRRLPSVRPTTSRSTSHPFRRICGSTCAAPRASGSPGPRHRQVMGAARCGSPPRRNYRTFFPSTRAAVDGSFRSSRQMG